jgi:hypothetical protein
VETVEIDRAVVDFHQSLIVCNLPLVAEGSIRALELGGIYRGRPLSHKTDLLTVRRPCARDTGHLERILTRRLLHAGGRLRRDEARAGGGPRRDLSRRVCLVDVGRELRGVGL